MNKAELVKAVAYEAELTQHDADKAVSALFEVMTRVLSQGDKITIAGFGTFDVRQRAERSRLIPGTREEVVVPAKRVPAFKPGTILKNYVNR